MFSFDRIDPDPFVIFQPIPGRLVVSLQAFRMNQHMPHSERIETAVQMQLTVLNRNDRSSKRCQIFFQELEAVLVGALVDANQHRVRVEYDNIAALEQASVRWAQDFSGSMCCRCCLIVSISSVRLCTAMLAILYRPNARGSALICETRRVSHPVEIQNNSPNV